MVERMDYSFFLKGLAIVMWWGERTATDPLSRVSTSQKCVCPVGLAALSVSENLCNACVDENQSLRIHLIARTDYRKSFGSFHI